ncbi:MAG: tRNA (adenosine(37)-N6)-threonylcarbamoyltransferase complex ATPase subunit type 1 TsaE [Gammaproteobacteria bacterium]|nr:MAG: tRNA (adenosine(37)-N6)-threonylcarbamoyltransferase complex ATPase subunit type 1 TsaE [Gammaproteobacteria bacterium]
MQNFAKKLSQDLKAPLIIFLKGDLGSGKTTLTRFILQELGYNGKVKSPTYTLIETYEFNNFIINHLDLYRITDPEEVLFLGLEDIMNAKTITFIEWPQKATEFLPLPDIIIEIISDKNNNSRQIKLSSKI